MAINRLAPVPAWFSRHGFAGLATRGGVVLRGGTFVLDNTAINNNNRLRDAGAGSTSLETIGGGTFSLIGNAAGTTETICCLQLGAAGNERSVR